MVNRFDKHKVGQKNHALMLQLSSPPLIRCVDGEGQFQFNTTVESKKAESGQHLLNISDCDSIQADCLCLMMRFVVKN